MPSAASETRRRSVPEITLRSVLVLLAVALAVLLAWLLRQVLVVAFVALLVAAAFHAPVDALERRGWPRIAAVAAAYLALVAVFGLLMLLILPPLIGQAIQMGQQAPEFFETGRDWMESQIRRFAGQDTADEAFDNAGEVLQGMLGNADVLLTIPLAILGAVVDFVIALLLSAFMLLERDRARKWLLAIVGSDSGELVVDLSRKAALKLGAYVRGLLLVMTVTGVSLGVGMVVIGLLTTGEPIPFVFPLALLAFLAEAIPMAGPLISGIPIALVAFLQSPLTGLLMMAWIIVVQQLEGMVLIPLVQGHAVQLSPMVVLVAIISGAALAGIIGAVIAVPLVAVLDVVISEVIIPLRRRRDGERAPAPSG